MDASTIKGYLSQKYGKGVRDVRNVGKYRRRDIDFILPNDQQVSTLTNEGQPGYLWFEAARDHGFAGQFYRSKADQWALIDGTVAYLFRLPEAQGWVCQNLRPGWLTTKQDGAETLVGYRIPVADFLAGVKAEVIA